VEKELCGLADADASKRFVVYNGRPSGILPADAGLAARATGKLYGAINVDHLAKAFIRVVLEGYKERIIENEVLMTL
jgi:hypothetical protein